MNHIPSKPVNMAEFAPVECAACGGGRFQSLHFVQLFRHRLSADALMRGVVAYRCVRCGAQVRFDGAVSTAKDPDFLSFDELSRLGGGP